MIELKATSGALCEAKLLNSAEVAEGVYLLKLDVQQGMPAPEAGQFFHVKCGEGKEHILRRPLSAHYAESGKDGLRLEFLVEVAGWGTEWLCSMDPGERVNMLGPLGRGFDFSGTGRVLLVSGGIGIAPLFLLASELEKSGRPYDLLAGFKSGKKVYGALDRLAGGLSVYTEDGTTGTRGMVVDGVESCLGRGYDTVFTCGPEGMMSSVAVMCEVAGVPCQVSLDSRMACGIGVCRGCVKEGTDGHGLCVCTEGPVFDSRRVAWRK